MGDSMVSWKQLIENLDKHLDHEDIDEMRLLIYGSTERRINSLKREFDNLNAESFDNEKYDVDIDGYKDHLIDLMVNANNIKSLADELSIMALFKSVELKISRVIDNKFKDNGKRTFYGKLKLISGDDDVDKLDGYIAYNELRLINNALKHEGMVTKELATAYPLWVEGEKLEHLDTTYARLLPHVKYFVSETVSKIYYLSA